MSLRWALPFVAAVLVLAACGGDGDDDEAEAPATTASGTTGCSNVEQPAQRQPEPQDPPAALLDADATHRVTVKTNCGDFTITLDPAASPRATASFVGLAEADYFDDTFFHRIVPGFVIQGGDPTGTGTGGPGYSTVDPPASDTTYENGVVAMAKSAAEAPGTAGSQFFVVTATDSGLPPDYAVIGKVTEGLDVVHRIGVLGDPTTEQPTQPVVIEDMLVETS